MSDQSNNIIVIALALSGLVHGLVFFYQSGNSNGDANTLDAYISVSLQSAQPPSTREPANKQIKENAQKNQNQEILTAKKEDVSLSQAKPVTSDEAVPQMTEVANSVQPEQDVAYSVDNEIKELSGEHRNVLLGLLHRKINEHKKYPYIAIRQRREGLVKINFVLHPDGHVTDISVVKSSRFNVLDTAARNAVEKASPFQVAGNYLQRSELFNVDIDFRLN